MKKKPVSLEEKRRAVEAIDAQHRRLFIEIMFRNPNPPMQSSLFKPALVVLTGEKRNL